MFTQLRLVNIFEKAWFSLSMKQQNISELYQLPQKGTSTFQEDLSRFLLVCIKQGLNVSKLLTYNLVYIYAES